VIERPAPASPTEGSHDPSWISGVPGQVTITGTTAGTITLRGCLRYGAQNSFTLSVAVVDATQHSSNVTSARLDRPAGAPEVPAGGGGESFGPAL